MSTARKKKDKSQKGDVIHIRSTPSDKSLIEKAADAVGLTISSFMLQNSIKAAQNGLLPGLLFVVFKCCLQCGIRSLRICESRQKQLSISFCKRNFLNLSKFFTSCLNGVLKHERANSQTDCISRFFNK